MTLLEALRKLRDEGPSSPHLGICGNIVIIMKNHAEATDEAGRACRLPRTDAGLVRELWYEQMLDLFVSFGLNREYPVPSADPELSDKHAFENSSNVWIGEYGDNRRALLARLIAHLEQYTEQEKK